MQLKRYCLAAGILLACATAADAADPFTITSSSFKDGTSLAIKYAGNEKSIPSCVGENISPAFQWSNAPDGTQSYALSMTDPEGI